MVKNYWFPGHMYQAQQALFDLSSQTDVVVEIVDARAPSSSTNQRLNNYFSSQPMVKIISKTDLADPEVTQKWLAYWKDDQKVIAGCLTGKKNQFLASLYQKIIDLSPRGKGSLIKPTRVMVIGLPNVGKSTVINQLKGNKISKTGDQPALTMKQANIVLNDKRIFIRDTPGIMPIKSKSEQSFLRLGLCNIIDHGAMDYIRACEFLINVMQQDYPDNLGQRYQLDEKQNLSRYTASEIIDFIGEKIGTHKKNGHINKHQVSEKIITDFRQKKLGRLSLETPETEDQDD